MCVGDRGHTEQKGMVDDHRFIGHTKGWRKGENNESEQPRSYTVVGGLRIGGVVGWWQGRLRQFALHIY